MEIDEQEKCKEVLGVTESYNVVLGDHAGKPDELMSCHPTRHLSYPPFIWVRNYHSREETRVRIEFILLQLAGLSFPK
jgi:hypothetical protein